MPIHSNRDFSKGEKQSPSWTYQFFDLIYVEAGSSIVPAKIDSHASREFVAIQLTRKDLSFALECFKEASRLGVPDSANIQSKALIFSAVVAYARPFKTSVREIKLDAPYFVNSCPGFDLELHNYIVAVRDKHVAHSVNDFEGCQVTGVMVGSPDRTKWQAVGIGFTEHSVTGFSLAIVETAIIQIEAMLVAITADLDRRRVALYEVFRAKFDQDGKWELAPMFNFPSREKAPDRRK